jgi:hypothetical protein
MACTCAVASISRDCNFNGVTPETEGDTR